MSSSDPTSAIFVTDTVEEMRVKVHRYAFSGGGATLVEHQACGGNTEVDVAYQWLRFFEHDDAALAHTKTEYESGRLSTYDIKERLCICLTPVLQTHQAARAALSSQDLTLVMTPRAMSFL
jgi:tryptophanyl-tRNA synthetase